MKRSLLFFTMGLFSFLFGASSPAETPEPKSKAEDAGRGLRQMMLTTPPAELGAQSTKEFPRVYGILMDLPISNGHTATVFSSSTGTASLYTTSTFGIIGGEGHASVRAAALQFTKAADTLFETATPTKEFPYPAVNRVRFYLLTFEGVRYFEMDMPGPMTRKSAGVDLFLLGQAVLTELRLIVQKKP